MALLQKILDSDEEEPVEGVEPKKKKIKVPTLFVLSVFIMFWFLNPKQNPEFIELEVIPAFVF